MRRLSFRTKLTLFYAALLAVVMGGAGSLLYRSAAARFDAVINARLTGLCSGLWGYIDFTGGQPVITYDPEQHEILHFVRSGARYYQLYDGEDGRVLAQSDDSALMHLELSPAQVIKSVGSPRFEDVEIRGVPLRFYSALFHYNRHHYLLRVGTVLEEEVSELAELRNILLVLIPVVTIFAALAGWWLAGRVLRPLQALQSAAQAIGITHLDRRLPLRGTNDELDALAQTFNEVFARLETSVGRIKQFTANISHELRTPLVVLQGETEIALMKPGLTEECRQILSSQLEEFDKLRKLTNQLLTLAQADAGQIRLQKEVVDISALACALRDHAEVLAASRGIDLCAKCPAPVAVAGDSSWLERMVLNLLDNAIKFTAPGGRVEIATGSSGAHAYIQVSDTGIGISAESLPHIFDRFYRSDSSRSEVEGAGLGLSLVKWIVEAHGGSIHATSTLGAGSQFTVLLPLSSKASFAAYAAGR
ncbi:MAG: ATP-binding protein [Terriglobales bacterium]